jgi:hypothetical protein
LQRELELIIRTIGGISRQVIITQEGEIPVVRTLIYADNFGTTAPTASPGVTVAEYTGWQIRGTSAETIWYSADGTSTSVRTSAVSLGYAGASGGSNVMLGSTTGGTFIINGIMPGDYQHFALSFGTNQNHDTISVSFSTDNGATWEPVPFNKTTTSWGLVQTDFSIDAIVDSFSLKFVSIPTTFGARIDDVELRGSNDPVLRLEVSPNSLDIPRGGASRNVNITSNTNWTATPNANWVSVSSTSGNGDYTLTVDVSENTTGEIRSAIITISADGLPNQIVVIEQNSVDVITLAHWNPTSATDLTDNVSGGTISVSTGAAINWANTQSAITSSNWHQTVGHHWLLTIPLTEEVSGTVNVKIVVTGSNTGPRDFIVRASSDNSTWTDGDTYTVGNVAITHADAQKSLNVELPAAISAGGTLYIRLATTSLSAIAGTLGSAGTNRLTEVIVTTTK